MVRNKIQTVISSKVNQKKIKSSREQCHLNVLYGFDGLFTNLPRVIVAYVFSQSSFKLRRVILPLLTKKVSYCENCLSYQAKIFLVN